MEACKHETFNQNIKAKLDSISKGVEMHIEGINVRFYFILWL